MKVKVFKNLMIYLYQKALFGRKDLPIQTIKRGNIQQKPNMKE